APEAADSAARAARAPSSGVGGETDPSPRPRSKIAAAGTRGVTVPSRPAAGKPRPASAGGPTTPPTAPSPTAGPPAGAGAAARAWGECAGAVGRGPRGQARGPPGGRAASADVAADGRPRRRPHHTQSGHPGLGELPGMAEADAGNFEDPTRADRTDACLRRAA